MNDHLARTPLYDWHVEQSGRMVDFAGWSMPVQYGSIVQEHIACRTAAALFDVSHMGRLRFDGPNAAAFLDRLLTRRVDDLTPGRIRYSLMTNNEGGILDDVLVYHMEKPSGSRYHMLVVNAGNREKIVRWILQQQPEAMGVEFHDRTEDTAMLAVQGPRALEIVQPILDAPLEKLKNYTGVVTRSLGRVCLASRTGYTGEDGVELIVRGDEALDVCKNLIRSGTAAGLIPAGLGARDTLRLEAAMPLYGHELNESMDPFQAGLSFAVNLEDRDFLGRDALQKLQNETVRQRVGLELEGRRAAREGYSVWQGEQEVGSVTSGSFSPTLQKSIAMAYVLSDHAAPGGELEVDIRGRRTSARVVKLPFYKRSQ